MIGTVLDGRYEITGKLGQGGMGTVYEAVHVGMGRRVAVKVITAEDFTKKPSILKRFQREARATGVIETRHIVEVFDTGTDPNTGRPYLAMELLRGEDAGQLLLRLGPLQPELALRIAGQTCLGLRQAHEAGVIHRDVKPGNIYLAERDEGEVIVKILDFGVAKIKMENAGTMQDSALTRTGGMVGSPPYMSPEQARGHKSIDHRADVWSLGVVLYELLCGRTPFAQAEGLGDLIMYICGEATPPVQRFAPWVPPEIAAVVHDALRCAAADRFQTAAEMLATIDALLPEGRELAVEQLEGVDETTRAAVAETLEIHPSTEVGAPRHCAPAAPVDHSLQARRSRASAARGSGAGRAAPAVATDDDGILERPAGTDVATQTGLAHSQEVEPRTRSGLALLLGAALLLGGLAVYGLTRAPAVSPQPNAASSAAPQARTDQPATSSEPADPAREDPPAEAEADAGAEPANSATSSAAAVPAPPATTRAERPGPSPRPATTAPGPTKPPGDFAGEGGFGGRK